MFCPYCTKGDGEGSKTKVLETRMYWDETGKYFYIERRRECLRCDERFTTKERSPRVRGK
jgi:transcriptional regulator NrdR family protein